jgi:hypothetical protein
MPVEHKATIEFKHEVQLAWLNLHVFSNEIVCFRARSTGAMAVMAHDANHAKAVAGGVQTSELNKNDWLLAES